MLRTSQALCGALAATAITLALSACGGDDPAEPEPPAPPTTQPPATTAAPAEDGGSSAAPGEITEPGTELAVGETAVVPFDDGATIAITVTSIEVGDQAAFEADFDDTEGVVPYYIWFTAENLSDQDMSFASLPRLRAVTEDGIGTGAVLFGSSSGDCENLSFPDDAGQGTVIESCSLQASPEGVEAAGAQYDASEGDYTENPITWWT